VAKVPKDCLAISVLSDVLSRDVTDNQPIAMGVPEGKENFLTSKNEIIRNCSISNPLSREALQYILKSAPNVLEDRKKEYTPHPIRLSVSNATPASM
jgi:hypothetical protein